MCQGASTRRESSGTVPFLGVDPARVRRPPLSTVEISAAVDGTSRWAQELEKPAAGNEPGQRKKYKEFSSVAEGWLSTLQRQIARLWELPGGS